MRALTSLVVFHSLFFLFSSVCVSGAAHHSQPCTLTLAVITASMKYATAPVANHVFVLSAAHTQTHMPQLDSLPLQPLTLSLSLTQTQARTVL